MIVAMIVELIYAICIAACLLINILWTLLRWVSKSTRYRIIFLLAKHVVYPIVIRRTRFFPPITRLFILITLLHWAGTLACNLVNITSLAQAGQRAGILSVINLAPVLMFWSLGSAATWTGLSLRTVQLVHGSFGAMALLQGIAHVVIQLTQSSFNTQNIIQLSGLLAGVPVGFIFLFSIFRHRYYELVSKTHLLLAIFASLALTRHLSFISRSLVLYLIVPFSCFAASLACQIITSLRRNLVRVRKGSNITVKRVDEVLKVTIHPVRPWRVHAGQFIYLWMPQASFWSFLQTHPYMVTWWERDNQGEAAKIECLIKIQNGFSKHLSECTGSHRRLSVWTIGPYGLHTDYGDYGSVFLFASGAGIAAQIPHAKEIIEGFQRLEVRTRRLFVIWQLDREPNENWVQDWMQALLELDKGSYILNIRLYILDDFRDQSANIGDTKGYGEHGSIKKLYARVDLAALLEQELQQVKGKILLSVAADEDIRDEIHGIVARKASKQIQLVFSSYQPKRRTSFWHQDSTKHLAKGVV